MNNIICEFSGHEWQDAGGGLEICITCQSEQWSQEDDKLTEDQLEEEYRVERHD